MVASFRPSSLLPLPFLVYAFVRGLNKIPSSRPRPSQSLSLTPSSLPKGEIKSDKAFPSTTQCDLTFRNKETQIWIVAK